MEEKFNEVSKSPEKNYSYYPRFDIDERIREMQQEMSLIEMKMAETNLREKLIASDADMKLKYSQVS